MKTCTYCGKEYDDAKSVCAIDGVLLVPVEALRGKPKQDKAGMRINKVLFSFRGRIPRPTFWIAWLLMLGLNFLAVTLIATAKSKGDAELSLIFLLIWAPFSIWIGFAIQVKRWHDRGKSGWMVLINCIPIIGTLWALVELGFLPGTMGGNEYGETPLQMRQGPRWQFIVLSLVVPGLGSVFLRGKRRIYVMVVLNAAVMFALFFFGFVWSHVLFGMNGGLKSAPLLFFLTYVVLLWIGTILTSRDYQAVQSSCHEIKAASHETGVRAEP
jgi:uncharacterized membrane protein YhaH (DUF805 family)